jgi:hypothetical protein
MMSKMNRERNSLMDGGDMVGSMECGSSRFPVSGKALAAGFSRFNEPASALPLSYSPNDANLKELHLVFESKGTEKPQICMFPS